MLCEGESLLCDDSYSIVSDVVGSFLLLLCRIAVCHVV
jgi:hypothetical protein